MSSIAVVITWIVVLFASIYAIANGYENGPLLMGLAAVLSIIVYGVAKD